MSNDKTTEQPIPSDFREWAEGAKKYLKDEDLMIAYTSGAFDSYCYLHSLPPSPVGEAGAFAEWIDKNKLISSGDGFWYEQPEYAHEGQYGICVATNTKGLYDIFAASRPNPSRAGEIPEDIMQWIIAHPDEDYVSFPGKYIGFEPAYWRGVMTLYRTMKGKEKVLTEELAEIKLSFHQAVGEVKRLTTQLSGK